MDENLKKLAEFISAQDEETMKKVSKMEEKELIAYAAENGFTITAEELEEAKKQAEEKKKAAEDGELSDDELDAVAGGTICACPVAGGGAEDLQREDDGRYSGDGGCACVGYGQGDAIENDRHVRSRCVCMLAGAGV